MEENLGKIFEFEMKPTREFYYNETNFYSISEIATDTNLPESKFDKITEKYITKLVGRSVPLDTSKKYKVKAKMIYNEKYGYQYEIISIDLVMSNDAQTGQNNNYLQAIVTEKQYNTISEHYPNIIQDILDNPNFEPDFKLLNGIGKKSWVKIKEKIIKYQNIGKILALLVPLGVTNNMIDKLVKYEPNLDILRKKLTDNPYEFVKIQGFGFSTVDKLALKLNPDLVTSKFRVTACTMHILEQQALDGNLWISIQEFGRLFSNIIPTSSPHFTECFEHVKELIQVERELTKTNSSTILHVVDDMIGLQKYYRIETQIWENLKRINNAENFVPTTNIQAVIQETNDYFSTENRKVELTDEQISAIKSTIDNKVVIITANAGCGKTVCIKGIMNLYKFHNVVTAALSGKAARRIEETTNIPSNTIHRLLEWSQAQDGFTRNQDNPLCVDMVILDECSMIDDYLLLNLLKAIPDHAKLILVFDDAQLSPIGAGCPAKDLLSSNLCINRLTKIHRQAESSGIKLDANKIRKNIDIFTDNDCEIDDSGNRVLTETVVHGADEDMEITMFNDTKFSQEKMFDMAYDTYFNILMQNNRNVDEVTIVVPKKDGLNSTRNFNERIQEKLLGHVQKKIVLFDNETKKNKIFKNGARVIQRKVNDYERNVMNGEIGIIIDIDEKFCTISFDGGDKIVNMPINLMYNMELAYAITVHSMQGSECKNVIIVLDNSHYILLDCALFYTAVTRAQQKCILIMQPTAYKNALLKNKTERRTYLPEIMSKDM